MTDHNTNRSFLRNAWTILYHASHSAVRRSLLLQSTAVALFTIVLLLCTSQQGFVRDEGYYFRAAQEYNQYFEVIPNILKKQGFPALFSGTTIDKYFSYNPEHPGLVKLFMGFTWNLLHKQLGWLSPSNAFRFAAMVLVAVGNAFLYLFGARLFSPKAGALAVLLLLACPHVFYHSHLACFDGPIMGMSVVATYAFWRSLLSARWVVPAGIAWGLAIATKHNALFLVPTFFLAYVLVHWRQCGANKQGLKLPSIPLAFIAMAICGPLIFLLFYPYGWPDPIGRIRAYFEFHLHHEHYPVDYFGTLYTAPPFPMHFPFVMSFITIPLPILCMGILGILFLLYRFFTKKRGTPEHVPADARDAPLPSSITHHREGLALLFLSIIVPPLIIAIPSVPIFGGTKHWITMMPFFCLAAAWAVLAALRVGQTNEHPPQERTSRTRLLRYAPVFLLSATVLVPAIETIRTHPLQHTYFNELIFGHQGGALLGMPRTFWGGDARTLLPVLNEQASQRARIFTDRMNLDDFRAYQREGLLRADLQFSGSIDGADWAFVNHQREYQDNVYRIWNRTGDKRASAVVQFDGVPIVSLYRLHQ